MHVRLELEGESFDLYLVREKGVIRVEVDGEIMDAHIVDESDEGLKIKVGASPRDAGEIDGSEGGVVWDEFLVKLTGDEQVRVDGEPVPVAVTDFRPGGAPGAHAGGAGGAAIVKPPMPGKIVSVKVSEGDEVQKGDVLLVLEAMKMQNEIPAPTSGTVQKVHVEEGKNVEAKDVLVEIG